MTDLTPATSGETITSAAELDALPLGAVLDDANHEVYMRIQGVVKGSSRWVCMHDIVAVPVFPATVLYRPDRPAAVTVSDEGRAAAEERMGRVMGWQYLVRYSGQKPEWMADTLGALARAVLASRPQAAASVSREQIATARREFFDVMSRSYLSSEAMADDMVHSIRRALGIEVRDE